LVQLARATPATRASGEHRAALVELARAAAIRQHKIDCATSARRPATTRHRRG